jgi:hypothetical protein
VLEREKVFCSNWGAPQDSEAILDFCGPRLSTRPPPYINFRCWIHIARTIYLSRKQNPTILVELLYTIVY